MKNISLAILVPLFLVPIIFSSCSKSVVVDYSSSWSDISVKDDNIKLLALGKKTPGILYAFSKRNMYVSKDAGVSWGKKEGLAFKPEHILKAETDISGALYLLLEVNDNLEGCLVKTLDEGVTLVTVADPKTLPLPEKKGGRGGITRFSVHSKQPGNIIIAGFQQASVLATKNGGKDWQLLPSGMEGRKNFSFAEFDRENTSILYFEEGEGPMTEGFDRSCVYRSQDGGNTWKLLFEKNKGEGRVSSMAAVPGSVSALFGFKLIGVDFPELIKTTQLTGEKGEIVSLPVKSFSGRIMDLSAGKDGSYFAHFVDQKSRVMRSMDGGVKWEDLQAPLKAGSECVLQLVLDPDNPEALYVLAQDYATNATKILVFRK